MEMRLGTDTSPTDTATDMGDVGKLVMRAPIWTWLLLPVLLVGGWYMATHGYENQRVSSAAFSRTSSGYSFGCHRLFGFKGQTITIEYDITDMPRGHFKVSVLRPLKSISEGPVLYRTIRQPGSGQFEVKLPATGFYTVGCDGSPDGNGYDVTYEASWRVS